MAHGRRHDHPSRSSSDSTCPGPPRLALHLLQASPSSTLHLPGRNQPSSGRPPLKLHPRRRFASSGPFPRLPTVKIVPLVSPRPSPSFSPPSPRRSVAEPPELSRLKCAGHHHKGNIDSNALQTEQFLVCPVTSRYNHRISDRTSIPRTKASPEILQPYILQHRHRDRKSVV